MDGWYFVMVNGALLINNEIIYLISFIHAITHEAPQRCTRKRVKEGNDFLREKLVE